MSSLALLIFIIPILTQAQTAECGDFIYMNDDMEERYPIEDCEDPFGLSYAGLVKDFNFTIDDNVLNEGEVREVASLPATIVLPQAEILSEYDNSYFVLYRHEEDDYRFVDEDYTNNPSEIIFTINATGTYSIVTSFDMNPVLSERRDSWWQKVLTEFIPVAQAQYLPTPVMGVLTFTLTTPPPPPTPTGASSVLFLPGIQASRLYKDGLLGAEDQLWEPNRNQDVEQLEMTDVGLSVNEIYTKDVIDEALGFVGIYDTFIDFMDGLAADEKIKDWEPFAYDWRYDVLDVARNGTQYENERRYLEATLRGLADDSFSGQVTIIAHSNGGLLAKALLIEFPELAELVDKIIFLGVPQLGTPTAVGALLHGYDQTKLGGALVSASTARRATKNMPGAYGLLPGQAYFLNAEDLVVSFDTSQTTKFFRDAYGNAINYESELRDFLVGNEGRATAMDVDQALLANENLVDEAFTYRRNLLDTWLAPEGIEVYEVVGVGLDTESGFEYTEFSERVCKDPEPFVERECVTRIFYRPVPWISQYGDETVMGLSARGYGGESKEFFVDLFETNNKHANLSELESIQELLSTIISSEDLEGMTIPLVSTEAPVYSRNRSLISTHSPVRLLIEDEVGQQTGLTMGTDGPVIKAEIPGSSYRELAGAKYIIVPEGVSYNVLIEAEDDGGMTFMVHELRGEEQEKIIAIAIAEISSTTRITLSNTGGADLASFTNLLIDLESDGQVDREITPVGDEVVIPVTEVTYEDLKVALKSLALKRAEEKVLLQVVKLAEQFSDKKGKAFDRIEDRFLQEVEQSLIRLERRGKITEAQLRHIADIINELISK